MKILIFTFLQFFIVSAFGQTKAVDTTPVNPNVKEVIVIFMTHLDIGYTHRVKDVVQYYRTEMIDNALNVMDETRDLPKAQQFSWTMQGWLADKVVQDWPGQTPERRKRLEEAFRSGRFVCLATPFNLQSQIMFPEDFARSLEYSSFVSRKYGLPLPRAGKMADVPSQANLLATGLARGGVKFMHIGSNWPSGYVKYPPLFWWQGPDGSRVLTMYSSIYGSTTGLNWPLEWGGKDPYIGTGLIPPADWPYPVWPAIIVTIDNSGPPKASQVKALFDEAARRMPGVKLRVGRLSDFADAILPLHLNLPVVKGQAPDTWIQGDMSDPGGMKIERNLNPFIPALEALNTQLGNWKLKVADLTKDISKAYENVLLYEEHTWGGAGSVNKYGEAFRQLSPDTYKDLEASWEDKTNYIRTAKKIVRPLLTTNLSILAQNVDQAGRRYIVYNPMPYSRSAWVKVKGENKYIHARDIPASGYKTYTEKDLVDNATSNLSSEVKNNTIENKFFKIRFDPAHASIASFIDKRTGRDWADPAAPQGLGQYMNERFTYEQTVKYVTDYQQGRAQNKERNWLHPGMYKPGMISEKKVPYRAALSQNGQLSITKNAHQTIAVMDMAADTANHFPSSSLKIILEDDAPYVDMEITLKDKAKDNWPEADWFCFPFKINDPKFTVGTALGMMDPATDILEGADKDLYAVGTGVTITDKDGSGIALCPFDHPLISLDRPGIWKFSKDFVPHKPIIYLNLYNNQWNTNYRYWYPGTWSSKVRLWTFTKNSTLASRLVAPSLEARTPLLVAEADGVAGKLPKEAQGIAVSRKCIQVTAFRHNNVDNPVFADPAITAGPKATLLRLWEQGGNSGSVTVSFPATVIYTRATPVNLRGEVMGRPLKITANKLTFYLHAYAPASFVLN